VYRYIEPIYRYEYARQPADGQPEAPSGARPGRSTLFGVSLRPESIRGAGPAAGLGQIDYRLVRKHAVDEFKRGRLSRLDLCDAQPELMRAATNCGRASEQLCPICEESNVVLVSFVFGSRLPAHGRCVTTAKELDRLSRRQSQCACYVVEVCPSCAWNHLLRTFVLGGADRSR
jgi:hypothetical protein